MEEEYTIGIASGFQVSGKNYYSRNFTTLEEAKAHKKMLEESPKVEKTEVRSYPKPKEEKNVKK
jgi:hypothetical protein